MNYISLALLWLVVAGFEFEWLHPGPGVFWGWFAVGFVVLNVVFAFVSIFSSEGR